MNLQYLKEQSIEDRNDLFVKINKLEDFIGFSDDFTELNDVKKQLLTAQVDAMKTYARRLECFYLTLKKFDILGVEKNNYIIYNSRL